MIHVGDNSWNLRIFITDLQVEKHLRVRGDQHIGGIMLQLVDPENPKDWSDHALWWPEKNMWLTRTRSTLDQVGVQADCLLHFTPMHKILRVQLPDLRYLDCRVDFSIKTFAAVVNLCKDLDIRHPEEMSLCKPLEAEHLKKNFGKFPQKKIPIAEPNGTVYLQPAADTNSFIPINSAYHGSNGSLDRTQNGNFLCTTPVSPYGTTPRRAGTAPVTPISSPTGTWKHSSNGYMTYDSGSSLGDFQENLAASPRCPSPDVRSRLVRPKSLIEKARMNVGWLDSSLSIMEQGIREYDTLCVRFKYFTFFDLNPKYDQVRINQLYEQAKWAILNEELDCTEEESLMFAALQLQINQQNETYQGIDSGIGSLSAANNGTDDDIDSALNELQISLEGPNANAEGNITKIPELSDYLRFLKPRKFTMKGYKRYFFTYRDLHLHLYKSAEESRRAAPAITINLRGCEVTPDIVLSQGKFAIRLEVPPEGSNGPNSEVWIRCENEEQYAKWMAACRLASKGRSLADSSYESEVSNIQTLLNLQKPAHGVAFNIDARSIETIEYLPPRMLRKLSNKSAQRILEAHANVRKLSLTDAKLKYIQAWQSLPNFGVSLFVIKFDGHKKEELLGVAYNRIMRMDLSTGDHIKTWRYNTMKAWNVNWGIKCMMIQFHDENVVFSVQSADCKVVHEFIGGYIFMSMRSKENNQTLNEEMFHKLTGGWV